MDDDSRPPGPSDGPDGSDAGGGRAGRLPGWLPLLLYPVVALFSFPTLGHLLYGRSGFDYKLDTFDLPRIGTGADWLANGIQLWNTHLTGGNALLGSQSTTPFAFDVALEPLIGKFAAYVVFVWLLAAVAGIGMHLFLRDSMRLGTIATVTGSLIYLFGFWHYIYGFAAPAVPLLFWLMDRAIQPGPRRWRFVVGSVLATAFVLYHGLSQVVLFVGLALLLWLLVTRRRGEPLAPRILTFFGVWALALAIYAPLIATQLVMLPVSNRAYWDLQALYHPTTLEGLGSVVTQYSTLVFGVPVGGSVGASPGRYGTFFLGAIGMPLIVLGLVARRIDRRTAFLLGFVLLLPVWDAVVFLTGSIQAHLGFLRSFQLDRMRHVLPFVLAALLAVGVDVLADTLLRGRPLPRLGLPRRILLVLSLAPALIGIAVATVAVVQRRHAILDLKGPAVGWFLLLLALGIGTLLLVAAAWATWRADRGRLRTAGIAIVALLAVAVVGERVAYAWGTQLTDVPNYHGTWARTLGATPAVRFLQAQPGADVDRVLAFGGTANALAAADLLEVGGYQSLYPETYHRFFGTLIAPSLVGDPFHTTYYWKWGNRVITFGPEVDAELVALVGARWLLVHDGTVPTVPGIVERFRSGSDVVYEVPSVLPRAFVAGALDRVPDDGALLAALAQADLATLGATAFVAPQVREHALDEVGSLPATSTRPAGTARIVRYTPDQVEVAVSATGPGVLVLTDVAAPGWQADRDGVRVPIATVDETFRGVAVDAGTRTVVFSYRPGFTYLGFIAAAIALVLTLVLGFLVRRRDRAATAGRSAPS